MVNEKIEAQLTAEYNKEHEAEDIVYFANDRDYSYSGNRPRSGIGRDSV